MGNANWKQNERRCAKAIGGKRYWANSGESIDCHSPLFVAQVKRVKHISLPALERLAIDAERDASDFPRQQVFGVVGLKRTGGMKPMLFVMTEETMTALRIWMELRAAEIVRKWNEENPPSA